LKSAGQFRRPRYHACCQFCRSSPLSFGPITAPLLIRSVISSLPAPLRYLECCFLLICRECFCPRSSVGSSENKRFVFSPTLRCAHSHSSAMLVHSRSSLLIVTSDRPFHCCPLISVLCAFIKRVPCRFSVRECVRRFSSLCTSVSLYQSLRFPCE